MLQMLDLVRVVFLSRHFDLPDSFAAENPVLVAVKGECRVSLLH